MGFYVIIFFKLLLHLVMIILFEFKIFKHLSPSEYLAKL